MNRRTLLTQLTLASATALLPTASRAGQFTGKIRKSLKWSMAQKAAAGMSLTEAFTKLRDCGYAGVEPSLMGDHLSDVAAWTQASQESGLIIDGTVGGRLGALEPGLEKTKALGAESMLVVVGYDKDQSLLAQWARSRDELKAAATQAQKLGVKILLENVWASFFTSPFDLARFVDEIGSPWVQVHFDIGNMVRWGVPQHWAEVLGQRSQKLDVKEYDLDKAMKQGIAKGFDAPPRRRQHRLARRPRRASQDPLHRLGRRRSQSRRLALPRRSLPPDGQGLGSVKTNGQWSAETPVCFHLSARAMRHR